ncbi:ABC transporter ATP-binding protein [Burkholderia sp. 22PA0106]|uniref:ABC transporter ATP-binding protein n=1 Tax=Burkholderia sp. 22PA0106 TaxID=3237371 RepID=UPI0039C3DB28
MPAHPHIPDGAAAPILSLSQVSKSYVRGREHIQVLDGLDMEVFPGEMVSVMGPSGAGKSTLLDVLSGIARADQGRVRIAGHAFEQLPESQRTRLRGRHLGFVFQFYCLIPVLSAAQNVALPLDLWRLPRAERAERVHAALALVGMSHRHAHLPSELSGGEQQRVAIARAVAGNPEILLCDEPTGDLNREMGDAIMDLLETLCASHGKTIVIVTHDPAVAARAHRHFRLDHGKLVEYARETAAEA